MTLAAALAKAQSEFPPITKTKKVNTGKFNYAYAELSDIIAAVTPVLSANGLAISQPLRWKDGQPLLATVLLHAEGERLESEYPLNLNGSAQESGSAITYARRYSLCSILGITAEDDDDGAAATKPQAAKPQPAKEGGQQAKGKPPPGPRSPADPKHTIDELALKAKKNHLWRLAKSRGLDLVGVLEFFSDNDLDAENLTDVEHAISVLQQRGPAK